MNQDDKQKLTVEFNSYLNRINDQLIPLQDEAYQTGLQRGKTERRERQYDILAWAIKTFGVKTADHADERIRRFAEEAIELCQAAELDKEAMLNLVEYVYARPSGNINQEVGQVGVALLAFAQHKFISANFEEEEEFKRLQSLPADYWQARQNAKAEKGVGLASTADK